MARALSRSLVAPKETAVQHEESEEVCNMPVPFQCLMEQQPFCEKDASLYERTCSVPVARVL